MRIGQGPFRRASHPSASRFALSLRSLTANGSCPSRPRSLLFRPASSLRLSGMSTTPRSMASPQQVEIPPSESTVSVAIVDTTSWARKLPCYELFSPRFEGLDTMDICSYSFLITRRGRHLVFDLGIRKDWENLVPDEVSRLRSSGADISVQRELVDILRDGGVDMAKVDAAIWSHLHWDHTGDLASFPPSTDLIVGPGVVGRYMPGWPAVADAEFRETDVAGRRVRGFEVDDFNMTIGGLAALDYFGDGSFYLLHAPGHSTGHMNALARTSADDPPSFILLAADSVHLGGELRPSPSVPLPDAVDLPGLAPRPCPREALLRFHPRRGGGRDRSPDDDVHDDVPYLGLDPGFPENLAEAEETIEKLARFDGDDRVLVVFAHDDAHLRAATALELFPAPADGWRAKGWKARGRWAFLPELQKIAMGR